MTPQFSAAQHRSIRPGQPDRHDPMQKRVSHGPENALDNGRNSRATRLVLPAKA
jgi:hypothetical protein